MTTANDIVNSNFILQIGVNKKVFHSSEILFFVSENHKTYLVTDKDRWAYDKPLREIEKTLPNLNFVRIHRNAIVNLDYVKRFSKRSPLVITMTNDQNLTVSRSRRQEALKRYENFITAKHSPARMIFSKVVRSKDFASEKIWTRRDSKVRSAIETIPSLDLTERQKLLFLAQQPQAVWLGEWNRDIYADLSRLMRQANHSDSVPIFVIYRLFLREETYGKAIELSFVEDYLNWIRTIANVVGSSKAIIILEPNALCGLANNEDQDQVNLLISLLRSSIEILKQCPKIKLYIDAGNPNWLDAAHISIFLARAGVDIADGFALNVSNYIENDRNIGYGEEISRYLGGKHFVIDTGRNGRGIQNPDEWCNPDGVGLGSIPTLDVKHPLIDGYLWIKPPGESDGVGPEGVAPQDGMFWPQKAIELIDNWRSSSN
ncbi:glycoside hydrolase family 6 protein [Pseudobacteriovorax antillogorgiicola]|uniref:Glucanase n=2 Tax=Pseudobacteriovorax antillogorgiicola TaxID=1513793 RepID=A0A1Y6BGN5_9BACT|nr:glycoside hydrolase family 6 protein [Pseudobacteriovorax antillogorgiicola]TCS57340.1 LytTr DNA-binding domain-containing protein [Pseudobacteriovorax antillogorgiicola]SMF02293.1 LytTr DNA-binding domain-containing protein [Pseudobacteriovorax antillogorgiicola]